jgi:hypothetical protein
MCATTRSDDAAEAGAARIASLRAHGGHPLCARHPDWAMVPTALAPPPQPAAV